MSEVCAWQVNSDTQVVILEAKDSAAGVKLARAIQSEGGARAFVLQACLDLTLCTGHGKAAG